VFLRISLVVPIDCRNTGDFLREKGEKRTINFKPRGMGVLIFQSKSGGAGQSKKADDWLGDFIGILRMGIGVSVGITGAWGGILNVIVDGRLIFGWTDINSDMVVCSGKFLGFFRVILRWLSLLRFS